MHKDQPREFRTNRGSTHRLPLFLPVYQPREEVFQLAAWQNDPEIEGLIVNSFFLYKRREIREKLLGDAKENPRALASHVGFEGLLTTDSGAFQGFTRTLYLKNKTIVKFQDTIGSDVLAPLDLITPPGDNKVTAEKKMLATEKRVREALNVAKQGIVAGIQQGGRFLDLRRRSIAGLMEMGVKYLAIGSLVPFFNANHNLEFVAKVLRDAQSESGGQLPVHVYGAGDPCEIPFLFALGTTIFDSASYIRFAETGHFMTPYGALPSADLLKSGEFQCGCTVCQENSPEEIFSDTHLLARHNLWTICTTVERLRGISDEQLENYLAEILERHSLWFPQSKLRASWESLC